MDLVEPLFGAAPGDTWSVALLVEGAGSPDTSTVIVNVPDPGMRDSPLTREAATVPLLPPDNVIQLGLLPVLLGHPTI